MIGVVICKTEHTSILNTVISQPLNRYSCKEYLLQSHINRCRAVPPPHIFFVSVQDKENERTKRYCSEISYSHTSIALKLGKNKLYPHIYEYVPWLLQVSNAFSNVFACHLS